VSERVSERTSKKKKLEMMTMWPIEGRTVPYRTANTSVGPGVVWHIFALGAMCASDKRQCDNVTAVNLWSTLRERERERERETLIVAIVHNGDQPTTDQQSKQATRRGRSSISISSSANYPLLLLHTHFHHPVGCCVRKSRMDQCIS